MDQKELFIDCTKQQLTDFYIKLRDMKRSDAILKAKIEGFMFAGVVLGISDNTELKQLMEDVHQEVFQMSVKERQIDSALKKNNPESWSVFDKPAWGR